MSSEENKIKNFKEHLLTVLDDDEIQEKLKSIFALRKTECATIPVKESEDSQWKDLQKEKEKADEQIRWYEAELREAKETISRMEIEMNRISCECDRVSSQCRELETELAQSRAKSEREKKEYKNCYEELQGILNETKQKLRQQNREITKKQKDLEEWKKISAPFAETLQIYRQVQSLSPGVKKRVQAYFNPDTPVAFLVSAGQENNLLQLWNIAQKEIEDCPSGDKSVLLELLAYSIERVNDSYHTSRYALRRDQAGARFDNRFHSRSRDSSPHSGNIKEVVLPGIDRVDMGKVECQSVVRI